MKNNTLLITGGSGFVGQNLVNSLKDKYSIVVISLSSDKMPGVTHYVHDLMQPCTDLVKKINPSLIIHLAARVDQGRTSDLLWPTMHDNLKMAFHLYQAALELKNLQCIITLGSFEEYGNNSTPFVETMPESPLSPYSLSKIQMRYLTDYFFRIYGLPLVFLRSSSLYGEHQGQRQFIPYCIQQCIGDEAVEMSTGEQQRDFLYIGDFCHAVEQILKNPKKLIGEVVNVCSGEAISLKEAAGIIKSESGSTSELHFGKRQSWPHDQKVMLGSYTKLNRLTGWIPKYSFKDGIKKSIAWFRRGT